MTTTQSDTRPLRLWPAVVLVALQAFAVFAIPRLAPATVAHFVGVMGGAFIGTLLILLWWLFFSRASWRERLVGLALALAASVVAFLLLDPSAQQAMLTVGLPLLCLASVAWLLLSRGLEPRRRRIGAVVVLLVATFGWTLVRTNGVTGEILTDYAFRWSKTAEERLLAQVGDAIEPAMAAAEDALPATADAAWPGFRGPERDNRVTGLRIDTAWDTSPPEEIWRHAVGPGWGSFAVVGDRIYTQEQRGEDEIVACYDAGNGSPVWLHRDPARFWESMGGAGPRATPTYDDGRLYTVGATGVVNALDAATGERLWSRELVADTGAKLPDWGFASSPLIVGENVIVFAGGPDGKGVVSYDRATGEPRWYAPSGLISYSSPHLTTLGGVPQVMILTDAGATSIDAANGAVLWDYAWPLPGGSRIVQPYVTGDGRVLIGTGFGLGVRSIEVARDGNDWIVAEGWTSRGLKPYFNDFVAHRGQLYGFDGAILASVDATTGERNWKRGRYGNGQLLLIADQDLLLVQAEDGDVVLVAADPAEWREIARMPALGGKTWNHPVLVGDRLYVRNDQEAACYRLSTITVSARR